MIIFSLSFKISKSFSVFMLPLFTNDNTNTLDHCIVEPKKNIPCKLMENHGFNHHLRFDKFRLAYFMLSISDNIYNSYNFVSILIDSNHIP